MALLKDETQQDGNVASYWIITNWPSDKLIASGNITLLGYNSEQIRQDAERKGFCARKTVYIDQEAWNQIYANVVQNGANIFVELYEHVKQTPTQEQDSSETPFFKDATSDHSDTA